MKIKVKDFTGMSTRIEQIFILKTINKRKLLVAHQ